MNTKKTIIVISTLIVLLLSTYLIYTEIAPKESAIPEDASPSDNQPNIPENVGKKLINISVATNNETILTDINGKTLYFFTKDEKGKSNCFDLCVDNWPPLTIEPLKQLEIGEGVNEDLLTAISRDNVLQLVYNGNPLYTYIKDINPGDMTGSGIPNWEVAKP